MTTASIDTSAFNFICELIRNKSAIELDATKLYLVESRLTPVARSHGFGSIGPLVDELRKPNSQALTREVVEAITTHETSFFRDLNPFEALRLVLLPELIRQRSTTRTLNIWSNACSSGQEIYSVAMMLREHFPELGGWKIRLVATDLSQQVLKKAEQGLFNQTEANRGLPMPMLVKYFRREGLNWRINEEIRKMIEFKVINLIEPFPMLPSFDVVFLRNVLIYFSPQTKTEILKRVRTVIRPDGVLLLGGAESTMNLNVPYVRETVGACSVYRPG